MKDAHIQQQANRIRDEIISLNGGLDVAIETIMAACDGLRYLSEETGNERIAELSMRIFEACAVHDIATQRLNKVLRLLARLEDPNLPAEDPLLEGPQHEGKGVSQEAVNRLLGDDD